MTVFLKLLAEVFRGLLSPRPPSGPRPENRVAEIEARYSRGGRCC
jgi:hypothetical protein